jgi:hypothetical protein
MRIIDRVDTDGQLSIEVFEDIGDQTVLPEHHHGVLGAEQKVGHKGAVHYLQPTHPQKYQLGQVSGFLVGQVLEFVIRKVGPQMLDVKPGLVAGIEPRNQLVQPGSPDDEHDLVFGQALHETRGLLFAITGEQLA